MRSTRSIACLLPLSVGILLLSAFLVAPVTLAKPKKAVEEAKPLDGLKSSTFSGLKARSIGPAVTSGRIIEIAIHPDHPDTFYVATAAGGVWKTVNHGTTWEPIFDNEGSSSIGTVTIDPKNPQVIWIGTGENNSQRSVGYGDGVYRSRDGGQTWDHLGLKDSEHIAKILIDPRDSNTVYVAAQGPLWRSGGERGLYKTTDGGATWTNLLEEQLDEHTGVTDLLIDPRDPDVLYAAAYQRRRHVWTLINGGPGSALYKSTDGGETWRELTNGLPSVDMGRIGLAMSPINPDMLFAIVEAARKSDGSSGGGFFRSVDRGENWEKRSGYVSASPQYYQEIIPDPHNIDRIYSNDVWMQVSEDGGKTFRRVGERHKHVDNHSLWISPHTPDHIIAGCDGGIYETWDRGKTWKFHDNLPVTQFYKIEADNDFPFYNVYGGTQDNFTLGGPARTDSSHGILNSDWYVTLGGDGFQTRVDPENPDILYSQWQYGFLHRYDRKSGEKVDIQPQLGANGEGEDDMEPLVFNWDAPLIISPHAHTRLYFAAQRLLRSDDRGDTWQVVSPNLTRQLNREEFEVMDRVWSIEAVAKNRSTSIYGNIVALSESPLVENLLYVGTDDGLVQVSDDGGENWTRYDSFPGVPERTYVNRLDASLHDDSVVYAVFNNHKNGDFKPYLMRSNDRGKTWTSIAGDLPERGSAYAFAEDHERADLLFAGTDNGVYFTLDGGDHWVELTGGMPTVVVKDLAIQRRENDLVVGTFGRGFYVVDDYTPLRQLSAETLDTEAQILFPVRDAWQYIERMDLGLPGKSFQGDGFYTGDNPPFGAVFTYYQKDGVKTLREQRLDKEKELDEQKKAMEFPSWDALRQETREEDPRMILTITDASGNVIRRLTGSTSSGFHRVAWDLRFPAPDPVNLGSSGPFNPFMDPLVGPFVVPGTYTVSMALQAGGEITSVGEPQSFEVKSLGLATLPAEDAAALLAFQQKVGSLQRAVLGAGRALGEAEDRLAHLKAAILQTPAADTDLLGRTGHLIEQAEDLRIELNGDRLKSSYSSPTPPSITGRVYTIVSGNWHATAGATTTQERGYKLAADAFEPVLERLRQLIEVDLKALEQDVESAGGPWTPGRLPDWKP